MENTLAIFNELTKKLLNDEEQQPVAKLIPPDTMYEEMDLSLNRKGLEEQRFKIILEKLVLAAPKTASKAFFNQLFGGRNERAVLGELLAVMLNNSMYTYKAAGPMIGVEKVLIRAICDLLNWDDHSDGTFATGGSMTNFMGMIMARDACDNSIAKTGKQQHLRVYTSKESHYSIAKNAAFSGIGRNNVKYISTNAKGEMDVLALEKEIETDIKNGHLPCMVNATAATTVLGAFDDIDSISTICKKFNIWLHVDGAYGGSVLFSEKYKRLIHGIEKVDSFSINAHKMLGTPLTCSLIVVKNKENLYRSFSNDAEYLYQTDEDELNLGKISLQCGRRNDALKFWTLWKQVGSEGLENMVDKQFELADVAREYIRKNEDYSLYSFDDSVGVCFNYKDFSAKSICTLLYEKEALMVGYGTFNGVEFIRFVTINAQNDAEDIIHFFKTLESFIEKNAQQLVSVSNAEI